MGDLKREFNGVYEGECLDKVAFPMGGIGSGMICLEGSGGFSHFSLRHKPDVANYPCVFAALKVDGVSPAKVLEGTVAGWKVIYPFNSASTGNGNTVAHFGLPRFDNASFTEHFPFGTVSLRDEKVPLDVDVTGWSPFIPGNSKDSSLPVAGLEYSFKNTTFALVEGVFSFNARNFMAVGDGNGGGSVRKTDNGFTLSQSPLDAAPEAEGSFSVKVLDDVPIVNSAWFRGGWFDALTMLWSDIESGSLIEKGDVPDGDPSPGASLFIRLSIPPEAVKTVRLALSWHVPCSDVRSGRCGCSFDNASDCETETYKPWYSVEFPKNGEVVDYWADSYERLRGESAKFADRLCALPLPPEVAEAVSANLTILKSPTVMRQHDGRLWCWEGCCDSVGCCAGSCTHVWNYAQALPHLFPDLERTLRQTEFNENQDESGHQNFRAWLPIRPTDHESHAAADGQLGGIMKLHRDWRICGDDAWLRGSWDKARKSVDYCIATWDPDGEGVLVEPHHNTYDIEFWGPDGMCSSFYLGALKAMTLMGEALGEELGEYRSLYEKGREYMESELFNGEYFIQIIRWKDLKAGNPAETDTLVKSRYSKEALELMEREGPKYQYAGGCLSDGVIGDWMAEVCGIGEILDPEKVRSHLLAVHKYNLKKDLSEHANPQRPTYALGNEGGLLLCTWPLGGELSLPFVYSNEVWTGIEYQVASHLMMRGCVDEGLEIVREVRKRYDGRVRNPFNEYECGHWYARAMSSYALIQGITGEWPVI